MVDRLELAQGYVQELLRRRNDIIAAWVGGSVARGEDTESSDVDLMLVVAGDNDSDMTREGIDVWREGVYIEATVVAEQGYADLEAVLNDPVKSTHMNDALIIYDPTGFVARMQNAVRPVFMEPRWLGKRIDVWLEQARSSCSGLSDAVAARDPLKICSTLGMFTLSCISVPILRAGVTPSSSRGIIQLGAISPAIRARIFELEGSAQMSGDVVSALEPIVREAVQLAGPTWGQLPTYFAGKTLWMVQQGLHREALHDMLLVMVMAADSCLKGDDTALRARATTLARLWLQGVAMQELEILASKVQMAESLLGQIEALASMA